MIKIFSVEKLSRDFNPFKDQVWSSFNKTTPRDITKALNKGNLISPGQEEFDCDYPWPKYKHMGKIAWMVKHGNFSEPKYPLCIDEGEDPEWPIIDGNHRYIAAIHRGEKKIFAEFYGSDGFLATYQY